MYKFRIMLLNHMTAVINEIINILNEHRMWHILYVHELIAMPTG